MSNPFSTGDTETGAAADTAVTHLYAALTDRKHYIGGIDWSYDGAPTGGLLSVYLDAVSDEVFEISIAAAGPGELLFDPPRHTKQNQPVTVLLAAGGAGVTGKVNVNHWTG